jgi:hypothetical protein
MTRTLAPALLAVTLLAGCAATTNLSATQEGTQVTVAGKTETQVPRAVELPTTTFGNYEFKAEHPTQGALFGILPLKFNGGYLALDILFFAPAAFFNLREVYPFYQFDLEKKVVRYRSTEQEGWNAYEPSEAEAERARQALAKP